MMFIKNDKNKNKIARPMRPISFPREHLSNFVDLRKWMTPVEHQDDMNTCCANAFAGICEFLIKRFTGKHIDISRLFIYYNGQIISQRRHTVIDDGVEQRNIAFALRKYGFCTEKLWPYRKDLLNVEPSKECYVEAFRYTVIPLRIPFNIEAIETCLHNELPVLIDIKLVNHTGRYIQEHNGYLNIPNLNDTLLGGIDLHTVLLVGYNKRTKHFIVRNSWGGNWGYRGYFFMPYDYLSDLRLVNPHDGLWTIMEIVKRQNHLPTVRQLVLPPQRKKIRYH